MYLVYKTISVTEPVLLPAVKLHLGETGTHYDSLITSLITAARERAEVYMNRSLIDKAIVLMLDEMPANSRVELPEPPVKAVSSIKYKKTGEASLQTLAPEKYDAIVISEPGTVIFKEYIPDLEVGKYCIQIEYTVGYGDRTIETQDYKNPLPQPIISGILMAVRTMYDFREDLIKGTIVARVPQSAESLWDKYRIATFR